MSIDLFGEVVDDQAAVVRVVESYLGLAAALPTDAWLSLDLTRLALDTDPRGAADWLASASPSVK